MSKWQFEAKKKQRELNSFDYLLAIAFFIISFVLTIIGLVTSGEVTPTVNAALMILLTAAIFTAIGVKYRCDRQWRWQGVRGTDLYKAIGITALSIFMLPSIFVDLFYKFTRSNGSTEFSWQPDNRFNPVAVLSEAVRVFPEFISNPEHSTHLAFFCIMAFSIIFNVLVVWKIAYLSQTEFIQDCRNPKFNQNKPNVNSHNLRSPSTSNLITFFSCRPFIVQKQQNTVRITFNKVTSYDLKANCSLILFMSLFLIGAIYGVATTIIFILPEYLSNAEDSAERMALLFVCFAQMIPFTAIAFFIWNPWLRSIFIRTVIEFNSEQIIVWEKGFGSQRQILSIPQADLLPLQEKQINTQVPQVRNTSLRIRYRRRNIELAGHLLPEAMDTIQNTYDRYRQNKFTEFYHHTLELYLE